MQMDNNMISLLTIILTVSFITAIIFYGIYFQIQHYKQTNEYCNNKYGINSWELKETKESKHYIVDIWECVPLSKWNDTEVKK